MPKRCGKGTRRNKVTGNCDEYLPLMGPRRVYKFKDDINVYGSDNNVTAYARRGTKKCPRGYHRLGKSGKCSNKQKAKKDWLALATSGLGM